MLLADKTIWNWSDSCSIIFWGIFDHWGYIQWKCFFGHSQSQDVTVSVWKHDREGLTVKVLAGTPLMSKSKQKVGVELRGAKIFSWFLMLVKKAAQILQRGEDERFITSVKRPTRHRAGAPVCTVMHLPSFPSSHLTERYLQLLASHQIPESGLCFDTVKEDFTLTVKTIAVRSSSWCF